MKKIIIIAILIQTSIFAQVKGNGIIETRTFSTENLEALKINLYAKITIDYTLKEEMIITADSNLFSKIDKEIIDGKMNLNQLEWIQASKKIIIKIGAPNLKEIEKGTHGTLFIKNVNQESLNINAAVGKVLVFGNVNRLSIDAEIAEIDASKLIANNVSVNIWRRGKAIVYAENEIYSTIKNDGKLILVNTPKFLKGDSKKEIEEAHRTENSTISWIRFKIKNNSWNRNNFLVVGPKKDGSTFSYGFPMMPNSTRKENWSVGTKVYKVNKLGLRKLLVQIKTKDEEKTVNLF